MAWTPGVSPPELRLVKIISSGISTPSFSTKSVENLCTFLFFYPALAQQRILVDILIY